MTFTHINTQELVMIEAYYHQNVSVLKIANYMSRSRQTIHKVVSFLRTGHTALDYFKQYTENKKCCGRRPITLPNDQHEYIKQMIIKGWTPDVIIGRAERPIDCSVRTLYRQFKQGIFDEQSLPMKGKRKPNGHKEKRGKQQFKRGLLERQIDYPHFKNEFGHLEGDTIVGIHHKSAVITLVERVSKAIITLKPDGRKAQNIETTITKWFQRFPRNLFKSITFDCGKEFSNWKEMSNDNDVDIYFADPGTPSQRALNEHSNGLLRKDGLPKEMDFNQENQQFISSVAARRNQVPRKLLYYQTPLEVFLRHINEQELSNLI